LFRNDTQQYIYVYIYSVPCQHHWVETTPQRGHAGQQPTRTHLPYHEHPTPRTPARIRWQLQPLRGVRRPPAPSPSAPGSMTTRYMSTQRTNSNKQYYTWVTSRCLPSGEVARDFTAASRAEEPTPPVTPATPSPTKVLTVDAAKSDRLTATFRIQTSSSMCVCVCVCACVRARARFVSLCVRIWV